MPLLAAVDGSELVPVVKNGNKRTTVGAIAALSQTTNLYYNESTRVLSTSVGIPATLPLASAAVAGFIPAEWLTGAQPATLPDIHGDLTGVVYEHVRNASGAPMPALTPYHVIGNHGDTNTVLIGPADPQVPASMPASGILAEQLAPNAEGRGALAGVLTGVDTAAWASGTLLYVAVGGGLTATMPTAGVQAVAVVGRSHATTGTLGLLSGPALGTAAMASAGSFATAAQGTKADTAIQPSTLVTTLAGYVATTDPSVTNAREWIAATVDQAEAEAGTSTTRRAWTAQRVRQAVAGWWTATSTAAGRALVTAADAAAQRTALGLGNSATRNVGTASTDVAAGDAPATALASHLADADPHPVYLRSAEILAGTNMSVDTTTTPGSVILNATGGGTGSTPGGTSGQLQYNNAGAFAGVANTSVDPATGNTTFSARWINARNSAADAPANMMTGTWFTGGTSTTTKPHFLIEPSTVTTSNNWSTAGTALGINAPPTFSGNFVDYQLNGTSVASITNAGLLFARNGIRTNLSNANGFEAFWGAAFKICDISSAGDGSARIRLDAGGFISWNSALLAVTSPDLFILRDAANTLAQRNGTNAQATRIYNTFTSATSFERLNIRWASNEAIIDTEAGSGGGTLRGLKIGSASTSLLGFYGATPIARGAAVADATDAATVITQLNALLARVRAVGLIAT